MQITENGLSDEPGRLDDDDRVDYIRSHLAAVSRAIRDDCNVRYYTAWSLTDNFEWRQGYEERFGIHYINFTSDDKERIMKKSAQFFKDFMPSKTIEYEWVEPWGI